MPAVLVICLLLAPVERSFGVSSTSPTILCEWGAGPINATPMDFELVPGENNQWAFFLNRYISDTYNQDQGHEVFGPAIELSRQYVDAGVTDIRKWTFGSIEDPSYVVYVAKNKDGQWVGNYVGSRREYFYENQYYDLSQVIQYFNLHLQGSKAPNLTAYRLVLDFKCREK